MHSPSVLLVFYLGDKAAALPLKSVQRIVPMSQLARPPGLPSLLEGILNLAGSAVPVLRLDRLFGLPSQHLGLHSVLIIVNQVSDERVALLADRVSDILTIPTDISLPINEADSFNGCAEALVPVGGQMVYLLSPKRLLLEKDREVLSQFQAVAQRRLQEWNPEAP